MTDDALTSLRSALTHVGWEERGSRYLDYVSAVPAWKEASDPDISVVVIAHRGLADAARVLRALRDESDVRAQVVFVANGIEVSEHPLVELTDRCIELSTNTGAFLARNLGAVATSAGIVMFLEDDCVPDHRLLREHLRAHEQLDCVSVRGAYVPAKMTPTNRLARHYVPGDRPFPQHAIVEGNTSYRRDVFFAVGGWRDEIRFGGGGTELAVRIARHEGDLRRQVYWPGARIHHDYATDRAALTRKRARQERSFAELAKDPDYVMIRRIYAKYRERDQELLWREGRPAPAGGPPPLKVEIDPAGFATSVVVTAGRRPLAVRLGALSAADPGASEIVVAGSAVDQACLDEMEGVRCVGGGGTAFADRNTAAERCDGDVVVFLDGDDDWDERTVDVHRGCHERYDVVAVQGLTVGLVDGRPPAAQFPMPINATSNVSVARTVLEGAAAWPDDEGTGTSGLLLARAIVELEPDVRRQMFCADAIATVDRWSRRARTGGPTRDQVAKVLEERWSGWDRLLSISNRLLGAEWALRTRAVSRHEEADDEIRCYLAEHDFVRARSHLRRLVTEFPDAAGSHFGLSLTDLLDWDRIAEVARAGWAGAPSGSFERDDLGWFNDTDIWETPAAGVAVGRQWPTAPSVPL
ncbi:MAG: glycosyltransferase [bacterium]|nr:glycosyltransferase [bacterium]